MIDGPTGEGRKIDSHDSDVWSVAMSPSGDVRVVADPSSPSGYKVDLAPFPGWKDVPTW